MTQYKIFDPLNYLQSIGTTLSDFKAIEKDGKEFFILGKGNFAYTEKMISNKDNNIYAIKKLVKVEGLIDKSFERETKISIGLNHENIVKFYGYFETKENIGKFKEVYENDKKRKNLENQTEDKNIFCLVLEFAENGSLQDYYNKYKKQFKDKESFVPLDQKIVIKFAKQILDALKYIHQRNIAHRDIKPDNILLDKDNNIKIADFGISAVFKDENNSNENVEEILVSQYTMVGRRDYICPEIEHNKAYDCRCDIYSLGLTLLYLMSYENPITFVADPNTKIKYRHIKKNVDKTAYNKYLIKLIDRMLENEINNRPFARQAYDEIEYIEKIIENPEDEVAVKYLNNKNNKKVNLKIFERQKSNFIICDPKKKESKPVNNNIQNQSNSNCNNNIYPQMNQSPIYNNNCTPAFQNSCFQNSNPVYVYGNNSLMMNQDINYHKNLINNFNMMTNGAMINPNMMNNNTMIYSNMNNNNTMINNNMNNMMNNNNTVIYNNMNNMNNTNTMIYNNMNNMMNNNTMFGNNMNNTVIYNNINNNNMINNMMNNNTMNYNNMNNNTMVGNMMNSNTMMCGMMNNNTMMNDNTMICNNNINNNTILGNNNNMMSKSSMININNLYDHLLNDPSKQKNTSLISILQCLYECFKDCGIKFSSDLQNDTFASEIDKILNLIGKISSNDNEKEEFKKSIIKFRTEAAKNHEYFKGNDEIEPILAYFGLCNYINNHYKNNQNICPNEIYQNLTEIENLPKEKFHEIYDKINEFVKEFHSPFVSNFYYILLNISKCPNCNTIIKAKIEDRYSIGSFITLNGSLIDSIGNLVNSYISNQYNSENSFCSNCNYSGPGKKEKGFLNTPKYLLLDFDGEKEIKELDNEIDLTYNKITNLGYKKYKVFAFITKGKNDKYKAYIKKDDNKWFSYSDENTINDEIVCNNNTTPYLAIYKGIESS